MTAMRDVLLEIDPNNQEWVSLVPLMTQHFELMVRWNPVHNLTRDIEPERAALLHYRDSFLGLCALRDILSSAPERVCDVGSGAGFPALFLPYFFPKSRIQWVEKVAKKASFLRTVVGALEFEVEVLQQNVFDLSEVDLFITRATFPWQKLTALSKVGRACVGFVAADPTGPAWKEHIEKQNLNAFIHSYPLKEHKRALACWSLPDSNTFQ